MKRTILLTILVLNLIISAASAQTSEDQVIVDGDPTLTQSMLDKSRDLFEFVFGGQFSPSEKTAYEKEITRQWRTNRVEISKGVQDVLSVYDKALSANKEQLQALQPQLRSMFEKELRSQTDKDPLANILIGALDRIQGLNAKQGGSVPVPAQYQQQMQNEAGASIPRELVGEWVESHSSNMTYTNGYGGYAAPSGEKIILHFFPDGTYKGAYYVQSSMSAGCTMNVFMPSTGSWRWEDSTLKLNERTSHTISKDSCTARYNYEKDNKSGTYAYPARLETDQYGTKIVLTMNDGPHSFYLNTGKSLLSGN